MTSSVSYFATSDFGPDVSTEEEIAAVTAVVIDLELIINKVYFVEKLTGARSGVLIEGGAGIGVEVNARGLTIAIATLELLSRMCSALLSL